MISLPKNPYRGMLFNYLHSMLDEVSLQSALSGIPEIQAALTPKIKNQLVFLAYNKGISGVYKLLKAYAATRSSFHHVITESDLDLNKNLSLVQKILRLEPEKRALLKRSRVRKLTFAEYAVIRGAGYLSNIATARDYVQRTLGNSCGDL